MRYAIYITSIPGKASTYGGKDDYFCVLDNLKSCIDQVEEFRTWENAPYEESDFDPIDTVFNRIELENGRPITLESEYTAICIRPIRE